jgi:hypothetical protein
MCTKPGGMSLRPLLAGDASGWRDELFLENLYTGRDTPITEGIRRGKCAVSEQRMTNHERAFGAIAEERNSSMWIDSMAGVGVW